MCRDSSFSSQAKSGYTYLAILNVDSLMKWAEPAGNWGDIFRSDFQRCKVKK